MGASKDTYEVGLVMAGAVSAGAYTAGVVDYMLEALGHYEKIREAFAKENPGKNLHRVQIKVISGASAGGMTGTMLLSAMMDRNYRPMSGYDPATLSRADIDANVFYRSWVDSKDGIDISYLLDNSDITGGQALQSLLNCERLDYIANSVLSRPRELQDLDYIPKRIEHFVSVFNLAGVPYTMGFEGSSSQYGLVNHSDMMHFVYDSDPNAVYEANEIALGSDKGSTLNAAWKMLRQSTLATGAFPLALQARELAKDASAYEVWKWWVPQGDTIEGCANEGRCFAMTTILPDWSCRPKERYSFVCVDGGVANNEPLELARQTLAADEKFNPRDKNRAHRSVIMIDPFPSGPCIPAFKSEGNNLFKTAARLFSSLKEQARFKPDELEMARNPNIFSRFMIAPSREGSERGKELASASLGAFGGFLSEKFRQHDFQLGRKNCQSFLKKHFLVGAENPLVKEHLQWFRDKGCVVEKEGEVYVQVVPMAKFPDNDISKPLEAIDFDTIAMRQEEVDAIMFLVEKRIRTVIEKSYIISKAIDGITAKIDTGLFRWLAKNALRMIRGAISSYMVSKSSEAIRKIMQEDLKNRKLLH